MMSRGDISATLTRIATWLAPGGLLAFATVPFDVEDTEFEWMGHQARGSSYPAEAYPACSGKPGWKSCARTARCSTPTSRA